MRIFTQTLSTLVLLFTLSGLSAQNLNFDIHVSDEYIAAGTTELDLRFTLKNPTTESFTEINFVSDLYNWRTNELIADLSQELSDVDPNSNGILDAGETWELNIYQTIEAEQANTFVLNGAITAIDMFGNVEMEADASMLKVYAVNMDVNIEQECVAPGEKVDVTLTTRLLIDEDAAKNPGTTTIMVGGVPITIILPASQWEARDLMITATGLNNGLQFDPFNPPAGLELTNFCDQGGVDAGRNEANILDECEPIETVRAPCEVFGEDDILCEYPDWVFCYCLTIPEDFDGDEFVIDASDDFTIWKADESPAGSGEYDDFEDITANVESGGSDSDAVEVKASIIPVEMISFEAEKLNDKSELTWVTGSEINNSHFDIQRSTDGKTYEVIGTVKGNGTTTTIRTYQFIDNRPSSGKNYYRLAQYDFDGTNELSEVRVVDFNSLAATNSLSVYPNPAIDNVHIEAQDIAGEMTVMIFDMTGKLAIESKQAAGTDIDVSQLPAGQYTIKAYDSNRYLIGTQLMTKVER